MVNNRILICVLVIISFAQRAVAVCGLNTIKPYDPYLWITSYRGTGRFEFNIYGANFYKERGVRWDHTKICNVLQIWDCDQSALSMVKGFAPDSEIGQFSTQLNGVSDDGVRGHVIPTASFHMAEFGCGMRYWLPHNFFVGVYIPMYSMSLKNIEWCDCTKEIVAEDFLVKELLTGDLCSTVKKLGCLDICSPWKRVGIGDISALVCWQKNLPQPKPILTNVLLSLYAGISFPTGLRANEDQIFSIPFGYDGSPGILFGGRLGLTWKNHFVGGVELNFTQLIGDTRLRRIRTACDQTELLLLAKTSAHIDWGFIQRYRLYLGAKNIFKGFSFDVNYQFQKQGNSKVSICSNDYSSDIANTAQNLKEWTLHTIGVNLNYDFGYDLPDKAIIPAIGFFYQHDFKGRRSILTNKWGFVFGFSF